MDKKNSGTGSNKTILIIGGVAIFLVVVISGGLIAFFGVRGYMSGDLVASTELVSGTGAEEWSDDDFSMELISADDMPAPPMIPVLGNEVVATVNGVALNAMDVGFRLQEAQQILASEYFSMFPEDWDFDFDREFTGGITFGQAVREEAVRRSAIHVFYVNYADQHGIALSQEDFDMIADEMEFMEMQFGPELDDLLRSDGIQNIAHLESLFKAYMLMDHVLMAIIEDPVKFAEFEHLMEEVEEIEEELLGAKHILASFDNFDSQEEATAFAEELLARALAGEDFDVLIREYGQDPGMEFNPEGYTFTSGAMVPEFEDATLALAIGEISGLVPSSFGIRIIKRVEPNPYGDIMRPWGAQQPPTQEQLMVGAVLSGFELKLENAEIVFNEELNNIAVNWE